MSNESVKLLRERRSVRQFKNEQVSRETLDEILDIATFAPSGKGLQNPMMVAVREPETLDKLRKMNAEILGADIDPYFGAPTIVVVFSPTDGSTYVEDACCVLTYITLAAKALGVATCWIHRERAMFKTEEGKRLKAEWGVPEKYVAIDGIALGYQDGNDPVPAPRKAGNVKWVE
jgi:nitroreductase